MCRYNKYGLLAHTHTHTDLSVALIIENLFRTQLRTTPVYSLFRDRHSEKYYTSKFVFYFELSKNTKIIVQDEQHVDNFTYRRDFSTDFWLSHKETTGKIEKRVN